MQSSIIWKKTVHFKEANVLDELPKLAEAGEQFDVVISRPTGVYQVTRSNQECNQRIP